MKEKKPVICGSFMFNRSEAFYVLLHFTCGLIQASPKCTSCFFPIVYGDFC